MFPLWVVRVADDDRELRPWHSIYVYSIESRLIMRVILPLFARQDLTHELYEILREKAFFREVSTMPNPKPRKPRV
jgi:hypothetical protein